MSRSVTRGPAGGRPRPAIRLRPAPVLDPPFDDEMPAQPGDRYDPRAEQLTLDIRAVAPSAAGGRSADAPPAAEPVPVSVSTESWRAARRFVGLYLEILNGYRPPGQIRSLSTPGNATAIVEHVAAARRRITDRPAASAHTRPPLRSARSRTGPTGPAGTRPPTASVPTRRPGTHAELVVLRRLRVCQPRDGVAEAAVVLGTSTRVWAVALRLETHDSRWLCTTVQTCDPDNQ